MILPLIAAALLAPGQATIENTKLLDRNRLPIAMIQRRSDRLATPKLSPKAFGEEKIQWEFEWLTAGFVRPDPVLEQYALRFRVYSQERKDRNDLGLRAARMLLRLWDLTADRFRIDHADDYKRIVDVYLAFGGEPGGEQMFAIDSQVSPPRKANVIYIYALQSFTDPVEMAREIAHEYGHAVLPAVGGYQAPEDWANGYLGEKLYLRWIRDDMRKRVLEPDDAMGATEAQLTQWLAANEAPLVAAASAEPPSAAKLKGRTRADMAAYEGLALYCSQILPDRVFGRAMRLTASVKAEDFPAAILMAIQEPDGYTLRIPEYLRGRDIWVPVGEGSLSGVTLLKKKDGWAQIRAVATPVVYTPKR